jgi:hypothetical protein
MRRRPSSAVAGAGSSPALVFVALVALVLLGIGAAWLVLRGDSTTNAPPVAAAPMEEPPPPPTTSDIEPATTDETATATRDPAFKDALNSAREYKMRDPKTGKVSTITMHALEGTVVDDRDSEPVYYFWIYLIPVDQGDPMVATNTWSPSHFRGGKFQLDHQPAGTYNLVVESREHEAVSREIAVPYETGKLEVRLHHGSCIRGVVRDPSQMGLEEIEVDLGVVSVDPGFQPPMQRIAKTDKMGRYSFWKVPPGSYTLKATLLGDELANEPQFRLDSGGEVLRDFTLQRLGSLKLSLY